MTVKACVFCEHCKYEWPEYYSDVTYDDGGFLCARGQFVGKLPEQMQEGFIYRKAQSCEHFSLRKDLRGE